MSCSISTQCNKSSTNETTSAEKHLLYLPMEECKTQEIRQPKFDQQKLTKMKDLQMVRGIIQEM